MSRLIAVSGFLLLVSQALSYPYYPTNCCGGQQQVIQQGCNDCCCGQQQPVIQQGCNDGCHQQPIVQQPPIFQPPIFQPPVFQPPVFQPPVIQAPRLCNPVCQGQAQCCVSGPIVGYPYPTPYGGSGYSSAFGYSQQLQHQPFQHQPLQQQPLQQQQFQRPIGAGK